MVLYNSRENNRDDIVPGCAHTNPHEENPVFLPSQSALGIRPGDVAREPNGEAILVLHEQYAPGLNYGSIASKPPIYVTRMAELSERLIFNS